MKESHPDSIGEIFDADEDMQELLADLPKAWATCPGDPVETLLGPHIRAAYGRGYISALEQRS